MRIGTRKSAMALAQTEEIARLSARPIPASTSRSSSSKPAATRTRPANCCAMAARAAHSSPKFARRMRRALQAAMHRQGRPGKRRRRPDHRGDLAARRRQRLAGAAPGRFAGGVSRIGGKGFKIGTNAVRRAAYLRRLFPEGTVIHFRGAADTRVSKLDRGDKQRLADGGEVGPADALVMARSGWSARMASRIAYDFRSRKCCPPWGRAS